MTAQNPVPIEELLAHRDWVHALARSLVLDANAADDLEQETWARALDRPPTDARSLRGWFARVVRHVLIDRRRADKARELRELAVARPEATGEDDVVARMDAMRRVVQAAYELAEPYRTTLLLRYFEGLSVRDIARRLDVPQDTVKTRLRRSLEQLRERFDADAGGDRRAWCAALLPLAVGAKSTLVKGGLVVTAKAKISLAVAAVLLLALTVSVAVVRANRETTRSSSSAASVDTANIDKAHRRDKSADAAKPAADVLAPTPRGTGAVVGSVRFVDGNKPAVGQKVTISTSGAAPIDATTDERGAFRFEKLAELRAWRVVVEAAPELAPVVVADVRLERDETRDVGVLWLATPTRLEVVVKDWSDKPVAGATVEMFPAPPTGAQGDSWTNSAIQRDAPKPTASAVADATGRAVIANVARGGWKIVARAPGFVPATSAQIGTGRSEAKQEITIRLDRGVRVEGRVLSRDRRPASGLLVWAGEPNVFAGAGVLPRATTDAEGRFVLDAVPAGEAKLFVGPAGTPPALGADVRVPTLAPIEIVLDGNVLEGRVTSAPDGAALAGARVRAWISVRSAGNWTVEAVADEDGRYRLDTLRASGINVVRVEHVGFVPFSENLYMSGGVVFANGRATRDFALRRGVAVSGRATSRDGPVIGARVAAWWGTETAGFGNVEGTTDADGRFAALSGVAPGVVVVKVYADAGQQTGLAFDWAVDLSWHRKPAGSLDVPETGLADVAITIAPVDVRAVSGRVETEAGAPVAGAVVSANGAKATSGDDGTFRIVDAPTSPRAWVSATKDASSSGPVEIAGEGAVADVVVRLKPPIHFTGRVATSGGNAPDGASVQLLFTPIPAGNYGEILHARVPVVDGRFDATSSSKSGPGTYRLLATAPGFGAVDSAKIAVEAGRTTYEVDLVFVDAPPRALEGRVVSDADESVGVAGARISLMPGNWQPSSNDSSARPVAALTDAEGRFRIPDVAASDVKIDLACDGFVHDVVPVHLPADGLVLKMTPALEIAGTVTLADGTPLACADVSIRRENDNRPDNWYSTQSGADGRFRLTGLPAGTYTAQTRGPMQSGTSVRFWEKAGIAAGTKDLAIVMEIAAEIAGRVIDVDGKPVVGCIVQAFSETGDRYTPSDSSKADGSFVVRGLGAGTYSLIASPPQPKRQNNMTFGGRFLGAKVEHLVGGAKDAEIRLPDGATIRGVLVDSTGAPMASAWIRADYLPGQPVDIWTNHVSEGVGAQTDAAGAFAITGLLPGRYGIVHVADPNVFGGGRPLRGGVDVASGASNVRLAAGGVATISGTVVDEEGKPIADASVGATPVGGGPVAAARTDASGAFAIKDASDLVHHSLSAWKSGSTLLPAMADDVAPGATGVVLRITRGLEASGRVLQKDGTLFKGYVALVLVGGDYRVVAQTDAEGRFTAKPLREGVYSVTESISSFRYGQRSTGRPCGTIKAGEKDVDLKMSE